MFVISELEDDIRVLPRDLTKPPLEAVTDVIEERFLDKVIEGLGLVVTIYDVQSIQGGFIYPNDGAAYFKCKFRLVVFRPFVGEVIVGKMVSCSRKGLKISLGFFEDVFVPEEHMQDPSFYDDQEKLWFWQYDENKMYVDLDQPVRFKVQAVKFHQEPAPLAIDSVTGQPATAGDGKPVIGTAAAPFAPMEIIADINGDGLGLVDWWAEAGDAAE